MFSEDRNGSAQKGLLDPTSDDRKLAQDTLSSYQLDSEIYSLRAEWGLENFAVNYVGSYQNDEIEVQRDNDRSDFSTLPPFTILGGSFDPEVDEQETITNEIYFVSNEQLFDRIDWIAGFFHLDSEVDVTILERLDKNFNGTFEPFTVDQVIGKWHSRNLKSRHLFYR